MVRSLHRPLIALLAAAGVVMGAACSEDTRDSITTDVKSAVTDVSDAAGDVTNDAAELAARNIATAQGEEQFNDAGAPLDDAGLTCEATVTKDASSVMITCSGTTKDGGTAELTGTTDELPGVSVTELKGDFTGTVDGKESFTTTKLGG